MDVKHVILVVEDDESFLEIYGVRLKRDNRIVIYAKSAEEAFDIVNDIAPDAIILDIGLPKLDGLEFIRTVFEEKIIPEVPVFIVSGCEEVSKRISGFLAGAARYFVKPVDLEDLNRCLDEALNRKNTNMDKAGVN